MRGREGRYLSVSKIEHYNFGVILWHGRFSCWSPLSDFLPRSLSEFLPDLGYCSLSNKSREAFNNF
jgi:hypothetical protein